MPIIAKQKRSKASRACDRCRNRKIKCQLSPSPSTITSNTDREDNESDSTPTSCANCLKTDAICTFTVLPPQPRKVKKLKWRYENLSFSDKNNNDNVDNHQDENKYESTGQSKPVSIDLRDDLITDRTSPTSTVAIDSKIDLLSTFASITQDYIIPLDYPYPHMQVNIPLYQPPVAQPEILDIDNPDHFAYTSPEKAKELHNIFFQDCGYLGEVIFTPKYKKNFDKRLPITLTLTYIIWAHSHLLLGDSERAIYFYEMCEAAIDKLLSNEETEIKTFNSVTLIQTYTILSDFEYRKGRTSKAPTTLSKAVRICQLKEYDCLDQSHPFSESPFEEKTVKFDEEVQDFPDWVIKEEIRRSFFKIFVHDKYISFNRGLPSNLIPSTIFTYLPSTVNLEFFGSLEMNETPNEIDLVTFGTPLLIDGLSAVRRGEILYNVSPFGIHILLLAVVHESLVWCRDICSPSPTTMNESTMNSNIITFNKFNSELDFLRNSFKTYQLNSLDYTDLTVHLIKIRMMQSLILLFSKLLKNNLENFTPNLNEIYFKVKSNCTIATINLFKLISRNELVNMVNKNPLFFICIHYAVKSSVQLFIISTQSNCKPFDNDLLNCLLQELKSIIKVFEAAKSTTMVIRDLASFYNEKLENLYSDPYESIFFQDHLGRLKVC